MVEPLLDIIFWHEERLTDIHICDCQQITVILKKYVVAVFKDSWLNSFNKLLYFDKRTLCPRTSWVLCTFLHTSKQVRVIDPCNAFQINEI